YITGLNYPLGLAFDGSGHFYVANYHGQTVLKYSSGGALLNTLPIPGGTQPFGVVCDSSDNLYVTAGGVVIKYSSSGTLITNAFISGLIFPEDMAFDASGNLYVVCGGPSGASVSKFNASGTLLYTLTSGLNLPNFIAISTPSSPPPSLNIAVSGNQSVLYWPI